MNLVPTDTYLQEESFSLNEIVDAFIFHQDIALGSQQTYRDCLKRFTNYLEENSLDFVDVNRATVLKFKENMMSHLSAESVKLTLTVLHAFFEFIDLHCQTRLSEITRSIKKPKVSRKNKRDALTADQVAIIITGLESKEKTEKNLRDKAIFILAVTTGLRVSEIAGIKRGHLGNKNGMAGIWVAGKGHDELSDFVKLTPLSEKALREYLACNDVYNDDDPLFSSLSNRNQAKNMTPRSISRILDGILQEFGFKSSRITPHSLRHTAISLAIEGSASGSSINASSLLDIQKMARHKYLGTTLGYVHELEEKHNTAGLNIDNMIQSSLFRLED